MVQSRLAIIFRLAAFHSLEGKMKLPRRRPIRKKKTPKDLAAQFLEWQKIRVEVFGAELTDAQRATAEFEQRLRETVPQPAKTNRPRGRTH
jgi:hypothetical protein